LDHLIVLNIVAFYKSIPSNYPARKSLLKVAGEGLERPRLAELFDVHVDTITKARAQQTL